MFSMGANCMSLAVWLGEDRDSVLKVTVDLQRPNFVNFVFFFPDIAKISIKSEKKLK